MRIFANHQKKRKKNGMNLINNRLSRHCAGIVCVIKQLKRGLKMDYILNYCLTNISKFKNMTDSEIYFWLCDNFYTKDYDMLRKCSFVIYYKCVGLQAGFFLPFFRALALCVRFDSGRHDFRKRLYCILRRSDRQSVRSTAKAVKTLYRAKYKA